MKKLLLMVTMFTAIVSSVGIEAGAVSGNYGACLMRCQAKNRSKSVSGAVLNCNATCKENPNAFARYL